MKTKSVIFILLFFPALVNAQYWFRPILDPTILCNERTSPKAHILNPLYDDDEDPYTKYGVYYIVEKMPVPKTSDDKMEKFLESDVRFNNREKTITENILLQCVVNCKGKAGDFQIRYCSPEMHNIKSQVLQSFKDNYTEWKPGIQQGKAVDVLIGITLLINEGKFHIPDTYNEAIPGAMKFKPK